MSNRFLVLAVTALFALTLAGTAGYAIFIGGSTYYFPQVADGKTGVGSTTFYTSEFFLNNVQSTSNTVTITFFQDNGSPWIIELRSKERSDAEGTQSSFTFNMAPYETVNFYTGSSGLLKTGWAMVQSSRPLVVSSSFTLYQSGSPAKLLWQAGVLPSPAGTQFSCQTNISPDEDMYTGVSSDTGFAIANPSGAVAHIMVSVLARWGYPEAAVTFVDVPAGGHTAFFLSEQWAQRYFGPTFHGMVRFSSNVAVSMVALRRSYSAGGVNDVYFTTPVQHEAELGHNIVWDTEPNSSIALAQPVTVPAEILGTSNSSDDTTDKDYYAITVEAGHTLHAFLLADTIGSPLDDALVLYNPSGFQIAAADNTFSGLADPVINYTVSVSGIYYLRCGSVTSTASRGAYYRLFVQIK